MVKERLAAAPPISHKTYLTNEARKPLSSGRFPKILYSFTVRLRQADIVALPVYDESRDLALLAQAV
jgi:hypothetical protein